MNSLHLFKQPSFFNAYTTAVDSFKHSLQTGLLLSAIGYALFNTFQVILKSMLVVVFVNCFCLFGWKISFCTELLYFTEFNNYVILCLFLITFASLFNKVFFISNWTNWGLKLFKSFMKHMFWLFKSHFLNKLFKSPSSELCRKYLSLIIHLYFVYIHIQYNNI